MLVGSVCLIDALGAIQRITPGCCGEEEEGCPTTCLQSFPLGTLRLEADEAIKDYH